MDFLTNMPVAASSTAASSAQLPRSRGLVLVIVDGLSDVPVASLDGKSPMQAASLPVLDMVSREGQCGLMDPVAPGLACGSDTAHMSLFGYEPRKLYRGRGAFEAQGDGLAVPPGSIAVKCNFAMLCEQTQIVLRRCADKNMAAEAASLAATLDRIVLPSFPDISVRVRHAIKHRCAVVIQGPGICDLVSDTDPLVDGEHLRRSMPKDPNNPNSVKTAAVMNEVSDVMRAILRVHPINVSRQEEGLPVANVLLLRGPSESITVAKKFEDLHELSAFLIAPTKIIAGVGLTVGLHVMKVNGATGDYNTDYTAKAFACANAMSQRRHTQGSVEWCYDLGIVHVKAVDDAGHDGDLERKITHLERVDAMVGIIGLELLRSRPDAMIMITGDHTTPVSFTDHSCDPVPCVVAPVVSFLRPERGKTSWVPDTVTHFEECEIGMHGCMGRFKGIELMNIIKHHLRTV